MFKITTSIFNHTLASLNQFSLKLCGSKKQFSKVKSWMFCCSSPIFQAQLTILMPDFPQFSRWNPHVSRSTICSPSFLPVLQAEESRATSHVQHGEGLLRGSQRIHWDFRHFSMVKLSLTEWIYDLQDGKTINQPWILEVAGWSKPIGAATAPMRRSKVSDAAWNQSSVDIDQQCSQIKYGARILTSPWYRFVSPQKHPRFFVWTVLSDSNPKTDSFVLTSVQSKFTQHDQEENGLARLLVAT